MVKTTFVSPTDEFRPITSVFSAPIVVKGKSWLPFVELITWLIMARIAKKRVPTRSWLQCLGVGALTMPIVLGSEWGHNFAHALAAQWVGKPVNAIRILWGTPILVYYDINETGVTPRQHILRALGGPLFNLLLVPIAFIARQCSKPDSLTRDVASAALAANLFIPLAGILPIPGIDGGALLKWSLVERGQSIQQADQTIQKVNGIMGAGLALGTSLAVKKRRWILAGVFSMFSVLSLSVGLGILKEQK